MPATASVTRQARTARFLASLICASPVSAWAAQTYQSQYLAFYGELLPRPDVVPLAEWMTAGTAVVLATAALLVLRSRRLQHRSRLGGLLALGAITAVVGASGLHFASEARAKPTPKFFAQNVVPFTCAGFTQFSSSDCFNGIVLPDNQDPASDPDEVLLANPYDQPVRIIQISLKQPDSSGLESVHLAPTNQGCFKNGTLPPVEPDAACITVGVTGDRDCYNSTLVLQPGETCNVTLADNP